MSWDIFILFALVAAPCLIVGSLAAWKNRIRAAYTFNIIGMAVLFAYILGLWITVGRPPLRTMGETRLWFAFFLPLVGIIIYSRWKYKWILTFSTVLAIVFILINVLKPEIHSKELMPALQSPWFAPHVIVYMFAYAMLGAAFVMAVYLLFFSRHDITGRESGICDNLVYVGLAFMTIGMLFGALWAQQAWGHYWAWDPKETWAAVTWFVYLTYIHLRLCRPKNAKSVLWLLIIGFVVLQMCWWGINYLPSARDISVHTYNME